MHYFCIARHILWVGLINTTVLTHFQHAANMDISLYTDDSYFDLHINKICMSWCMVNTYTCLLCFQCSQFCMLPASS